MYCKNKQGFRYYVHHEALNNIKSNFIKSAQNIVHSLKKQDLVVSNKSGIRPQLFDKNKKELVMDLKIEETENTLHVLNAISPAFTASFSFAELIVNKILEHNNDSLEEIGVTN
jgi:L-2-hydroxyglutarate oxidase LhgO